MSPQFGQVPKSPLAEAKQRLQTQRSFTLRGCASVVK
jgi:hypothetical protein